MSRRALVLVLLALAVAGLVAHSLYFNFVTDDAFISFVYSRNLAEHGQLVFNLGERVEGYTNFLWTVLLALLMKLHLQPELMSRLFGTAFGAGGMLVVAWLSRRLREARQWSPWDALPALVLAGVPGYACWSSGGLETQMFTFFVTLGSAQYLADAIADREPGRSSVSFALAALTRPEGLLFFAICGLHRVLTKLRARTLLPTAAELRWVGWFVLLVEPHLLWRRWYYGWWLPNTYYIKATGGAASWQRGGYYLLRFVEHFHLWMVPLLLIGGLFAHKERGARLFAGYAALAVGIFVAYVASVGGDFMGLYRFAMPIVPLVALAAAVGLRLLLERFGLVPQVAVVALLLGGHLWHAVRIDRWAMSFIGADHGIDTPAYLRWYTADRAAVGKWFGQYAQPDDYAAVGGAGAQVYYSHIPSLDCWGLSDAYVAHQMPAFDTRPGHQKYAPDSYILSRHPTIITSHNYRIESAPYVGPDEPMWRARGYHYVSVRVQGLSSPWYSFLLRNDRSFGPLPKLSEQEP
jgi:hypothetical protein